MCAHQVLAHMSRFKRFFVAIGHSVQVGRLFAIGYFGVDACFSKHHIFQQGYLHLLTMRDGNAHQMPLAWAMCETESGTTYEWFALWCKKAGLGQVLHAGTLIMSDRMKGIEKFMEAFLAWVGSCFKHITGLQEPHRRNWSKFQYGTGLGTAGSPNVRGFPSETDTDRSSISESS